MAYKGKRESLVNKLVVLTEFFKLCLLEQFNWSEFIDVVYTSAVKAVEHGKRTFVWLNSCAAFCICHFWLEMFSCTSIFMYIQKRSLKPTQSN